MRNQVSPFGNSNCFASFENAVSCGLDVCKAIGSTSIGILALLFCLLACVYSKQRSINALGNSSPPCAESEISHGLQVVTQLALPPSSFSGLFSNTFLDSSLI